MMKNRNVPKTEPETDESVQKKAVALKYDPEKNIAPKLIAKGNG